MKVKEFLTIIEKTGGFLFEEEEGNYFVTADKTIDFPDGSGKIYFSWNELLEYRMKNRSIREAIETLSDQQELAVYHTPVRFYDMEGNLRHEDDR